MPGGGLFSLIAYGSQNVILNGNPDFTYFYTVFKKHSHFAIESTSIPLEGPNEMFFDQPIKLRAKIPRVADLISDMNLTFNIPDIFSKYVQGRSQYEFEWVHFLGTHIIQNCAFFVGGSKIQEFDGDYILSKAQTDMDADMYHKWKRLVGEVPELINPAKGLYAGGQNNVGYPTVVKDTSMTQQFNRPSIYGQRITVPLPLWFSETSYKSFPIVALEYHDVEIQLTLRPVQELYTILDPSGYRVRPGYRMNSSTYDIQTNQPSYISHYDISGEFRAFATDIDYGVPTNNSWFLNPTLETTYVYVTQNERVDFVKTPLNYIVPQITTFRNPNFYNRATIDLEITNPVTRMFLVPRRSDSLLYRNAVENFTNWANYPTRPWLPTNGAPNVQNQLMSSGRLIPASQDQILRSLRILLNGNEYQEEKNIEYFTKFVPYKYYVGGNDVESKYLAVIPFSLKNDPNQPSGSINSSLIRLFQLDINPWALPLNPNYLYDITIYVESINFFVVKGGYGGLKYAG